MKLEINNKLFENDKQLKKIIYSDTVTDNSLLPSCKERYKKYNEVVFKKETLNLTKFSVTLFNKVFENIEKISIDGFDLDGTNLRGILNRKSIRYTLLNCNITKKELTLNVKELLIQDSQINNVRLVLNDQKI